MSVGPMLDPVELAARIQKIRDTIDEHAEKPESVTLVAVTKTFGVHVVEAALAAGLVDLGENYGQELAAKATDERLEGIDVRWHAIGPIQRNKVKKIAPFVWLWHTVDRPELATEIGKRAPGAQVLIQVNTTGEDQKSGCSPQALPKLLEHSQAQGLSVRGLMTVGPTDAMVDPRPSFAACRSLADQHGLKDCSMGMTRDLSEALREGSTIVRVGSALFGPRA